MSKHSAIDLLLKANQQKMIEVTFNIPAGDSHIMAKLRAPDYYSVLEAQEIIYKKKLHECLHEGLGDLPIDEDEWEAGLEGLSQEARQILEKKKPCNLAEQEAYKFSRFRTVHKLIPKFLRAPNGELLFPTLKAQDQFTDILYSNAELLTLITQKYIELTKKLADIEDQAKNLSTASPNGS